VFIDEATIDEGWIFLWESINYKLIKIHAR